MILFAILVAGEMIYPLRPIMEIASAQKRRSKRVPPATQQPPRGAAVKYSAFLHSSDKHESLTCNACHKVPTAWTAKRDFPDVAAFPNHDACIRCHRQQFFTRQSFVGTGPAICTVCHVRATPREAGRFVFGKPNGAGQAAKPKDERQFTIEFPHDKHQNVIAWLRNLRSISPSRETIEPARFTRVSFTRTDENQRASFAPHSSGHRPAIRRNLITITARSAIKGMSTWSVRQLRPSLTPRQR